MRTTMALTAGRSVDQLIVTVDTTAVTRTDERFAMLGTSERIARPLVLLMLILFALIILLLLVKKKYWNKYVQRQIHGNQDNSMCFHSEKSYVHSSSICKINMY